MLRPELHCSYIESLNTRTEDLSFWLTEHLRISGVYWGCTALRTLNKDPFPRTEMIEFLKSCYDPEIGGFSGNKGHDVHLLYTLSGVQLLLLYDALDTVDVDKIASYIQSLQQPDGSFQGDEWGEIDTRFSYCAVACLSLINRMEYFNKEKAVEFVLKCKNFDGGFGCIPGAESHAGQIFCCVGMLAITDSLHLIDHDLLGWWLSERQLKIGGLNGRPEKREDVFYSWWVLSSLSILNKLDWIDKDKLIKFILSCQDLETGGFSDRPGDMSDVFHTLFAIAGLSIVGYPDLEPIDPVYCMPVSVTKKFNLFRPFMNLNQKLGKYI